MMESLLHIILSKINTESYYTFIVSKLGKIVYVDKTGFLWPSHNYILLLKPYTLCFS